MTVNRVGVSFVGLFYIVARELRAWSPTPATSEKQCQIQLAAFLRELAPDAKIEREYLHMGCKIDAYIAHEGLSGWAEEILIEAKFNLASENEFKRLVGQIQMMKPNKNNLIIILFGETKPEFSSRLREMYPSTEGSIMEPYMTIIEKSLPTDL